MRRRAIAAAVAGLVAASLSVIVIGQARAAAGCRVTYAVTSQWPSGFGAKVALTNLGDPVTSWRLTWSFTAGQTVTQGWNGTFTQSGAAVTVANTTWNGALGTGAGVDIGFNGAWNNSANPVPTTFAMNGTACTGTTEPTPTSVSPSVGPTSASPSVGPTSSATPPQQPVGRVLNVAAGSAFRPVRHIAAGGLYALAENNRPADSTLLPLRMNSLVQPAPGVGQRPNGQPPGGDSLLIAPQADRVGAAQYIRMPDIYPNFPYQWVSWADWLSKVDTMVTARLNATNVSNIAGWEIWNEPDWTWNTSAAGSFNEGWVRTYRQIRSRDTVTPIVGPGTAGWQPSYMQSFLTHAKANNALPDVVVWHELNRTSASIAANVAAYRRMEQSLGISPRPISINEYAWTDEVDVPGRVANYIAKLERAGVADAERAFWYEYGTVNGLVTNNQPTGTWWLYKWYGDMAGNMVTTTPPAQSGLDGFAAFDGTRRILHVALGDEAGTNSVRVTGLGALGSTARITVESTPASGRFTAVAAPTVISTGTYQVTNGEVVVVIPNMSAGSAYHVVVQPTSGVPSYQQRYEAENGSVFRAATLTSSAASNGGYVGRIDNSGDKRTDSYVDFVVNVPTARSYTMTVRYANAGGAATQGLATNGGAFSTLSYPATAGAGQFGSVSTTVSLNAGYNVIRLAKGSPRFAGGTGSVELDYLELI
jgi:Cellulose binding domain/Carbohydrate binding module (family 35)